LRTRALQRQVYRTAPNLREREREGGGEGGGGVTPTDATEPFKLAFRGLGLRYMYLYGAISFGDSPWLFTRYESLAWRILKTITALWEPKRYLAHLKYTYILTFMRTTTDITFLVEWDARHNSTCLRCKFSWSWDTPNVSDTVAKDVRFCFGCVLIHPERSMLRKVVFS
jgi:hypothetical protein